jgi:hypothetical protein
MVRSPRESGGLTTHERLTSDGKKARVAVQHARDEEAPRTNEKRMRGQKEAFQAAIHGAPLEDSLGILAGIVTEETAGEARTAFYIADPDLTCLHPIRGAGDMPESYLKQVEGFVIGKDSLACGLATATGRPVLTRDVFEEPLWKPWVHLAKEYDFRGCWSFRSRHVMANQSAPLCSTSPRRVKPRCTILNSPM